MRPLPAILLLIAIVGGCSRPLSYEPFILKEDLSDQDGYFFNLDCTDVEATYSLSLYTRLERSFLTPFQTDSLDVRLRLISPSDSSYLTTMKYSLASPSDSSFFAKDYIFPYNENLQLKEEGTWQLKVYVKNPLEDLRGMGIIFKNNQNGTR